MGAERRSMAMSDEEKKLTAFHEAGHAIIAITVEGSDPIHSTPSSRRPRPGHGDAPAGTRSTVPDRQKMLADLCVAFGGRIAEELVFGHEKVTTGAQSDIEQATRYCTRHGDPFRHVVDELGPIAYAENQEEVFLGHSVSRTQNVPGSGWREDRSGNPPHHRRVVSTRP